MSTRATIYFTSRIHIYIEVFTNEVWVSYQGDDGANIELMLMPLEEWLRVGFPKYADKDIQK